jgi:hypothetical protein
LLLDGTHMIRCKSLLHSCSHPHRWSACVPLHNEHTRRLHSAFRRLHSSKVTVSHPASVGGEADGIHEEKETPQPFTGRPATGALHEVNDEEDLRWDEAFPTPINIPQRWDAGNVLTKPTVAYAREQPTELWQLSNDTLYLAARADPLAHNVHQERLIRNIMAVDALEYDQAQEKMREIFQHNRLSMTSPRLIPYDAGLVISLVSAGAAFPLVFM